MWARPDVLQYPWQLPVCGHTLSCHLQAGLQPRVRLSVLGQGWGELETGRCVIFRELGSLCTVLLCGWAPFPGRVSGRHMGSTLPELQGRASVPTGKCALRKSTCLQPLRAQACQDSTVSHTVMPHHEHGALGAERGQSWERLERAEQGIWKMYTYGDTATRTKSWTQEQTRKWHPETHTEPRDPHT